MRFAADHLHAAAGLSSTSWAKGWMSCMSFVAICRVRLHASEAPR